MKKKLTIEGGCFHTVKKALFIMKLTFVFLLAGILQVAAKASGQAKVSLKLDQVEIAKALKSIENQGDYRFLYNNNLKGLKQKIDINLSSVGIKDALDKMFNGTDLKYKVLENNLIVVLSNTMDVQDIKVTGKITGESGEALSGVSVSLKGSTVGTTTDNNGNFTLTVPEKGTLVISYIGYQSQELAVSSQSVINVSMIQSKKIMDEVVVVGYGSQRKVDVTGAVAQIKGDEIAKQSSFNPLSALQGKVAGLQVINSGSPGAPPQITIRGVGTVYGNTNPLFVVDGVWYDDISFINNSDIENVSILKDASSESIYGIRGANGVILITTKKGKRNGRAVVNYSGYVGNQVVTNEPKMATGPQYATMINEVYALSGSPSLYADPNSFGTTDWYHRILRNALVTSHQVSVAGGGEKNNYDFSIGYYHQDGLVKTNNFDRYTIHFGNDYQIAKFLKVGFNTIGSLSKSRDVPGGIFYDLFNAAPIVPVYYSDGSYGDPADYKIAAANQKNPQEEIDYYHQHTNTYKLNGNVYADLKLLKYFTFHTSAGGDFENAEIKNYTPYSNFPTIPVALRKAHSVLGITREETRNWIVENTLTFEKKFNEHSIKVLAGQGAQEYRFYKFFASAQDVPEASNLQYLSLGTAASANVTDIDNDQLPVLNRVNSYFGRINYSFADRYLINASLRADGTSKFSNSWGYFPSVGVGWVITNEKFMQNQNLFNNLKLRGSWGKIGNMTVPANLSILKVSQDPTLVYVGGDGSAATGASINTVVPPATFWERSLGTDIVLEASLLNGRLFAEVDWYNKKTEKAIFDIPVLGSVGTTSNTITGNQATFQNQGFEFLVTWKDNINKDWNYSISANAGINQNKVLDVVSGGNPIYQYLGAIVATRTVVGQPLGEFYGLQTTGIFQSADQVLNYKSKDGTVIQPNAKPGDFIYKDVNGDGVIDDKDRVVLGNPNPKFIYGINTNVSFKNFDLTLDFQGVSGVQIYNGNFALRYGGENYTEDFYKNRWHGQGTSNLYPSVNIAGNNSITNSFFTENGSYFRIRNMQLGYTIPGAKLKKAGISQLRVYVNAQNAFTWFPYRGFTPEIPAESPTKAGIDQNVYPLYATYNFGINLTF